MKIISNELYDKIPLISKLQCMDMNKLKTYAYKNFGVNWESKEYTNKADLIEEILIYHSDIEKLKVSKWNI